MHREASFEEKLARLDEITAELERGDVPLAQLLQLYEEGVQLTEQCRQFLAIAEQKVFEIQQRLPTSDPKVESERSTGLDGDPF